MQIVVEGVIVNIRARASKQDSELGRPVYLGSLHSFAVQPHFYK
jgi:hypothetical protein